MVNQFRYLWLQNNVSEIILDGEIENSETTLLNRFFQDFFPIPIGLLKEEQENSVFDFLLDCQLSSKSSRKLANSICSKKEINAQEFSSDREPGSQSGNRAVRHVFFEAQARSSPDSR